MTTSPQTEHYKPGDILAERYRIERPLGTGGMGVVLAARHKDLDTLVAIKLLRPEVLVNPELVARFTREARAAVRIKSEHVARVTDVGSLPNGSPYMVMEYLEGTDLAHLIRQRGALPAPQAIDYVLQATEAIAEAHSLGIVHRDLKPGNLFLSRRADGSELVKVLDFGISKMSCGTGQSAALTSTSALLGSPTYMSPEQLSSSRSVDVRTDIWALGVILYELLSGKTPFLADTIPEVFMAILTTTPPSLQTLGAVPAGLARVVERCLEKKREQRFANVGELAAALLPYAPPAGCISVERISRLVSSSIPKGTLPVPGLGDSSMTTAPRGSDTQEGWGQTARPGAPPVRSSRKLLWVGVAGALGTAGVATFMAVRQQDTSAGVEAVASQAPSHMPAPLFSAPATQPSTTPEVVPNRAPSADVVSASEEDDVNVEEPPRATAPTGRRAPQQRQAPISRAQPRPKKPAEAEAKTSPSTEATASKPTPIQTPPVSPEPRVTQVPKSDWEEDRR